MRLGIARGPWTSRSFNDRACKSLRLISLYREIVSNFHLSLASCGLVDSGHSANMSKSISYKERIYCLNSVHLHPMRKLTRSLSEVHCSVPSITFCLIWLRPPAETESLTTFLHCNVEAEHLANRIMKPTMVLILEDLTVSISMVMFLRASRNSV